MLKMGNQSLPSSLHSKRTQFQYGSNFSDAIHDLLNSLRTEIPQAVNVSTFYDHSVSIHAAITDMNFTLLAALVLVVIVISLYLGKIADTIIPSIVIPMTLIGTFIVMDDFSFQFGQSLSFSAYSCHRICHR